MPRPKPLVPLHGAVNFDRIVPFDSAINAPPLAVNDILVMRRAAGGDNLTLSIGDITATGAVNIDQLLGGANDDMLFRVAGIWTGTGPSGLTYDGNNLRLDTASGEMRFRGGAGISIEDGGGIAFEDAGGIELEDGNLEISGTGNIEVAGGGSIMVTDDGNIEMDSANGQLILSGGAEMLFEGGAGMLLENGAAIAFDGDGFIDFDGGAGDIIMGSGQILAKSGTQASPGFAFEGDPDTGVFGFGSGQVIFTSNGVQQFIVTPGSFSGTVGSAPILRNLAASSTVPNIVISSTDVNTGLGTAGADILSHIAGGVEGFRVAETGGIITNTFFGDLVAAGGGGAGPALLNVSASASVPTIIPNQADDDTGLSRDTINGLTMIAGGLGCIRARNIGGARAVGFYTTTPIVQQTGVAVSAAAIHAACVNLGLFTA